MKKNSKLLGILLVVLSIIGCKEAKAYVVSWSDRVQGQSPEVRKYVTSLDNGGTYMTYCLDPGRQFGGGTSQRAEYKDSTVLDLNKLTPGTGAYRFAIAATYIYQQMLDNGYANTSDEGRIVGQTAFRLARLKLWDGGNVGTTELSAAYNAYVNRTITGETSLINTAIKYADDGIRLAETYGNTPYEQLVNDENFKSNIWVPNYSTVNYKVIGYEGSNMKVTFTVNAPSNASSEYKSYADLFSVSCSNKTATCNVTKKEANGPGSVVIEMTVNIASWDGKDLGIYTDVTYCDSKAAAYQLAILENSQNSGNQYMLVLRPGTCLPTSNGRGSTHRIRIIPNQTCVCKYDGNGKWTNKYTIIKYENGVEKGTFDIDNGPEVSQYPDCPPAATCKEGSGDNCQCQYDSNGKWTGKYVLTSYTIINGVKTPKEPLLLPPDDSRVTGNDQCAKKCVCLKPEESPDGKYHCKQGDECDKTRFDKECGGTNEDIPTKTCACEYTASNQWTGKYVIYDYINGKLQNQHTVEADSEEAKALGCKPCNDPIKPTCKKPTGSDPNYYCKNGETCNKEQYEEECVTHHCQTPDESGDGNYYGKESAEGKGDGRKLGSDEAAKNEYLRQCTNTCKPTVSIPGTCADFDESGSYLKASINDINKTSTSCNTDVNPVTKCVLGGEDATGASYETTTGNAGGNKYCKVWCEESYDFNLPTARLSTSGEYFTLNMSIRGKRNCYTSSAEDPTKPIDKDKFLNDLTEARQAVIDAYNEYAKWSAAASIKSTETDSSCTHESHSYECNCSESCSRDETGAESCDTSCDTCTCDGCSATGKVVTKSWSWIEYDLEGNSKSMSDNYSDGETASCGHGSCTGKTGANPDESHKENAKNAKSRLTSAISRFYNVINDYNSCTGDVTVPNVITSGQSYTSNGWINDMRFNPEVTFSYNENYIENTNGNFKMKAGTKEEIISNEFCKGEIDDSYNCKSTANLVTSSNNGKVSSDILTTESMFICGPNGCSHKDISYSNAQWVKKSVTISADYGVDRTFSTLTPYGTIKIGQDGKKEFYTALPSDAFPISLITKTGAYPFKFKFKNIGQSNTSSDLGRLIGNSTSVLTAFNNLKASEKCSGTDKVAASNVTNDVNGGYVCHYINNCPDCTGSCTPQEKCELCLPGDPDCTDPCTDNCQAFCKNCIFDGSKATYSFKPVSLNNLFPNGIKSDYQGWNWNNKYKGQITQKQIETDGESVYEQPQFSVDLTIKDLKNIRDYNDDAGSFVNSKLPNGMSNKDGEDNAIYCDKETFLGKEYNVRCRSTFLDYMEEHKGTYGTIKERITRDSNGFELFTDDSVRSITHCAKEDNYACLNQVGIGPSWRVKKLGGR